MSRSTDPSCPVHSKSDVICVSHNGLARMYSHPGPEGRTILTELLQGGDLRTYRGVNRVSWAEKDG